MTLVVTERALPWHKATITDNPRFVKDCQRFIAEVVKGLPRKFTIYLVNEYCRRIKKYGQRSAAIFARERTQQAREILRAYSFSPEYAYKEQLRKYKAKELAATAQEILSVKREADSYEARLLAVFREIAAHCVDVAITPPVIDESVIESVEVAVLRMTCSKWYQRQLDKQAGYVREHLQIALKNVNKHKPYISDEGLFLFRSMRRKNEDYLSAFEMMCDETEQRVLLSEVAAKSTANPELRRVELMVRTRGMQDLAKSRDYEALFITWTAPSRFHATSKRWQGNTPKDTQTFLCTQWARARAKLDRLGVDFTGVRVTEPHKDETPHWHLLVFVAPSQKQLLIDVLTNYACRPDLGELVDIWAKRAQKNPGTDPLEPRFKVVEIDLNDETSGGAVGYIAKYISKNINAAEIEGEKDRDSALNQKDAAERVRAWASIWNIRQFQFFGGGKVSVYRELRRIKNPVLHEGLEAIRLAADAAKWCEFTALCEGQSIALEYEEIPQAGEYGEDVKRIKGVTLGEIFTQMTRLLKWRKAPRQAEQSEALSGGSRATRSTVNNCTGITEGLEKEMKILGFKPGHTQVLKRGGRVTHDGIHFYRLSADGGELIYSR